MIKTARSLLLLSLCALALAAPTAARAWSEMPAEAQKIIDEGGTAANCTSGCPDGMRMKTVPGGPPAFENCTDAYQFYISNGYELALTLLLQYAQAYTPSYLAACKANTSRIPESGVATADKLAAQAQDEITAIPAIMRRLILDRMALLVPAHCRANKPAQDEAAAAFDEWLAATDKYHKEQIADYIDSTNIECGQFVDTRAARVYDTDFTNTPLLGLTATITYSRYPQEVELMKAVLDYKSAYEASKSEAAGNFPRRLPVLYSMP